MWRGRHAYRECVGTRPQKVCNIELPAAECARNLAEAMSVEPDDGPTFVATEGWDWMPAIRDRDTGLWQGVSLTETGTVTLGDPQVITRLPLKLTLLHADGTRILPAYYCDNYLSPLPGEQRIVTVHAPVASCGSKGARFSLRGWNLPN